MKKKRGTIAILIVLAILLLGIGYAAMTANLQITGTAAAEVDDSNFKVIYSDAVAGTATFKSKTVTPTVTTTVNEADKTKATISISGFTAKDDEVTCTYTVKNESEDLTAKIGTPAVTTNSNATYFEVTSAVTGADTIAPGETTTQTVTVKCLKTPTTEAVTTNIVVDLAATLAE